MPKHFIIIVTVLVIVVPVTFAYIFQFDMNTGYTGNIALILLGHTDKTLLLDRLFPVVEIGAGIYIDEIEKSSMEIKPYILGGISFQVYKSVNMLILVEGVIAYSLTGFTLGLGADVHF